MPKYDSGELEVLREFARAMGMPKPVDIEGAAEALASFIDICTSKEKEPDAGDADEPTEDEPPEKKRGKSLLMIAIGGKRKMK